MGAMIIIFALCSMSVFVVGRPASNDRLIHHIQVDNPYLNSTIHIMQFRPPNDEELRAYLGPSSVVTNYMNVDQTGGLSPIPTISPLPALTTLGYPIYRKISSA